MGASDVISKTKITLSVAGLLAALLQPISFVQAAVLEEIIVTSERREASLQETPIAVSAITRQELEDLQIFEARDLQRYVPSLNMFNNITHPSNLSLSLRGGVIQDASLVVAESPVGIYVDDIYVGRLNGNNVTLSDIERIEVLRGPQGTLYGRNTSYGAIRFISRMPGEDMWADATVGAGNDSQLLASASVGGPLGSSWAGSLAGRYYEKDDQFQNFGTGEKVGNEENTSVRGKIRYMGLDRFDALLSVAYSSSENDSLQLVNATTPNNAIPDDCPSVLGRPCDMDAGEVATFTNDDLVFTNGPRGVNNPIAKLDPDPLRDRPQAETDQTIVGLTLSYDITDNMTFKSITGYVNSEDEWHTDFNGNTGAGAGFTGANTSDSDQWTQEFQLLGTAFDDRLNYIGGFFYLDEEADQLFGWNFLGEMSNSLITVESESISFFGDVSFNITDNLRLIGGLRWTEDDKKFRYDFERYDNFFNCCTGFAGLLPPTTEIIEFENDWSETTPRFVVEYSFGNVGDVLAGGMVYASAAKGFKGGGYSAISIITTEAVGVYEPDVNWTYEAGLKADWWSSRLRTNLAYFFSDIEDVQQNSTNPTGPGLEFPVDNIGDAEIQGLEAEITTVPVDGLRFFLTGTFFMDGEYKNLNPEGSAALAPDLFGVVAQTPQTPDYAYSIGGDYTIDLPGDFFGDLAFGADYYKIDDYVTASTNEFYNTGWDQWNGFIRLQMADNWEVKVTGKNLSDEDNVTSGSRGLGGFVMAPPREYLLQLTYRL